MTNYLGQSVSHPMSISMVISFGPIALLAGGSHAMAPGNASSPDTLLPGGASLSCSPGPCWEEMRSAWPLQAVKANMGSYVGQGALCFLATARPGCLTCRVRGSGHQDLQGSGGRWLQKAIGDEKTLEKLLSLPTVKEK